MISRERASSLQRRRHEALKRDLAGDPLDGICRGDGLIKEQVVSVEEVKGSDFPSEQKWIDDGGALSRRLVCTSRSGVTG